MLANRQRRADQADDQPIKHDPLSGHPPHDHGELAVRVVELHHAQLDGHDVEQEFNELISAWEARR